MRLSFRFGDLRLSFSFWFFCVIALFAYSNHYVLAWYIALPVLIHEAGHIVVMCLCGVKIQALEFTAVSINMQRQNNMGTTLAEDIAINLGGIIANLAAAAWLYFYHFQSMRIIFLVSANLVIAWFNLLPIGNLDGGMVCRIICEHLFTLSTARYISKLLSMLVLTPLFACAIFILLTGIGNFTLLLTSIYLAATVIIRE